MIPEKEKELLEETTEDEVLSTSDMDTLFEDKPQTGVFGNTPEEAANTQRSMIVFIESVVKEVIYPETKRRNRKKKAYIYEVIVTIGNITLNMFRFVTDEQLTKEQQFEMCNKMDSQTNFKHVIREESSVPFYRI